MFTLEFYSIDEESAFPTFITISKVRESLFVAFGQWWWDTHKNVLWITEPTEESKHWLRQVDGVGEVFLAKSDIPGVMLTQVMGTIYIKVEK